MAELSIAYNGLLSTAPTQDAPYFVDTLPIQYQPIAPNQQTRPPPTPTAPVYINVAAEEEQKRRVVAAPQPVVNQETKYLSTLKPVMPMPDIIKQLEKELMAVRKDRDLAVRDSAVKEAFVVTAQKTPTEQRLPVQSLVLVVLIALALHLFIKKFIKHLANANSSHELVFTIFYPILLGFILWFFVLNGKSTA